jgi:arsenite methyltransferase
MKRPFRLPRRPKPDYGIDRPGRIVSLAFAGAGALAAGLALPSLQVGEFEFTLIGPTLLALGFLSFGLCASMLAYSLRGKFNIRKRMLGAINWRGGEAVLDIGAGRGLLAIGAAKRLRMGTVVGIDDWDGAGAAEHRLEKAQRNLELARVHDRVELRSDDPRDIAFVDGSFDVVFSLQFLHLIGDAGGQARACCEIARVLKPGGMAVVADSANVKEYARAFAAAGLKVEGPKSYLLTAFSPLDLVIARKPGAQD